MKTLSAISTIVTLAKIYEQAKELGDNGNAIMSSVGNELEKCFTANYAEIAKHRTKNKKSHVIAVQRDGRVICLTNKEIETGKNEGKLSCIRLYRARTDLSLLDSNLDVEAYFDAKGLKFRCFF